MAMAVPVSPNRILTRLFLVISVALTVACAGTTPAPEEPAAAPVANTTSAPSTQSTAAAPAYSTEEKTSLPPAVGQVPGSGEIPLNPSHPDEYVVQVGDTLWDIASLFLRDPWYWPEIWHINPQVANPHLIYPGDILRLVYMDGLPKVVAERPERSDRISPSIRVEALEEAIPTIPYESISAFLSKPTILSKEQIDSSPYILSAREGHLVAGAGVDVYIRGTKATPGELFNVIHVGDPLIDPDTDRIVGYEGIYVGVGQITRTGDPATLHLLETTREASEGDRLFSQLAETPINFIPRAPSDQVEGQIIEVIDGVYVFGQYQIVVINRGARDGISPGHVLAVYQKGDVVKDPYAQRRGIMRSQIPEKVETPEEHAGVMMVFRVYERISYAMIMHATSEMRLHDIVRTP